VGTIVLFSSFFVLLLLDVPIAFALMGSSIVSMLFLGQSPLPIAQRMIVAGGSTSLLAIPFFIFAGDLMNRGGVTRRLVDLAYALVGHFRGALAQIAVVAHMFFAGVSGSAVADTAAVGTATVPTMLRAGYDRGFTAAVTGASGAIGMIVPPSIAIIILGIAANVSIAELFLAGIVPGLVIGIVQCIQCYVYAVRHGHAVVTEFSLSRLGRALLHAILPLITPAILVAGIVGGVFTPSEAGAVATVYALFLGVVVYRELDFKGVIEALVDTTVTTGLVMFLVLASFGFAWVVTIEKIPNAIALSLLGVTSTAWIMLLLMNVFVFICGCVLDPTPAILILVQILLPIATQFGIDPVHFGIIFIINMAISHLLPPAGVVLYTTCSICNISVTKAIPALLPFLALMIIELLIFMYFPGLTLALPKLLLR